VEQPGGGQAEVVHAATPPPPPIARPAPIKVKAQQPAEAAPTASAARLGPRPIDDHRLPPGTEIGAIAGSWPMVRSIPSSDVRLASFRVLLPQLLDELTASLTERVARRQIALPLILRVFG
jgi:hypothetical protein